jgi:hypothetical protein
MGGAEYFAGYAAWVFFVLFGYLGVFFRRSIG